MSPSAIFRPEIYDRTLPAHEARVRDLIDDGVIVFDSIVVQLGDLVRSRVPGRKLNDAEVERAMALELNGRDPEAYGRWVYYPWDRRLVHLLDEEAFRTVRADRNRALILPEQRKRLQSCCIGVVGLSAGYACAATMALEGVGGTFRLADFDRMELSNLNRVPAGVHSIGVNKAVLAARQLALLDPYLDVEVFEDGVVEENAEQFLGLRGRRLDLLVEECDDLYMKVRLRELAKEARIPVVMEMSFRGTVDVERFDIEPEREVLHGLLRGVRADALAGLTTEQKVPYVMAILGVSDLPPDFAGSLIEIDQTVSTWPQLASWLTIGGGLATGAARRVLLDLERRSGMFFSDGSVAPMPDRVATVPERLAEATAPRAHRALVRRTAGYPSRDEVEFLVHYGTMAPSGGNCQPWEFVAQRDRIDVFLHEQRSTTFLNVDHLGSYVAIGAAVENMVLAAEALGRVFDVRPFPDAARPRLVCSLVASGATEPKRSRLFEHIPRRVTNRRLGSPTPVTSDILTELRAAVGEGHLCWVDDRATLTEVAETLGEGDRVRLLSPIMHREMMNEIRWTPDEVAEKRDGIDLASLELSPTDVTAIRLLSAETGSFLRKIGGGRNLRKMARKSIAAASALALVSFPGRALESYFEGGRRLQRFWLTATAHNLAIQPMSALCYMFERLTRGGLDEDEVRSLHTLQDDWFRLLPHPKDDAEILLVRLATNGEPTALSLRFPLSEVLRFE